MRRPATRSPSASGAASSGFLRSLHIAAGVLIVADVVVQTAIWTHRLLTPVDIGGGPLGGAMDMDAAAWLIAMGGVLLAAVLRLPGFRLAWIVAGALPILLGALALWQYPDDHGGNLIISPPRSEIVLMMEVGAVFLVLGAILHRYMVVPTLSGLWLRRLATVARVLTMAAMALIFIILPVAKQIEAHRPPLPPCAHDASGQQLTLCL